MKIENMDINRCMNRHEQSKFHWNLNRNYTKRQGVENTSGDIHKTKFIRNAYRKPRRELREKYQFCWKRTCCTRGNYMQSLDWDFNDMIFVWKAKGNVTGIWCITKMKKEGEIQNECTVAHMNRRYVYSIWSLSSVSTSSIAFLFFIFVIHQIPVTFPLVFHTNIISLKSQSNDCI